MADIQGQGTSSYRLIPNDEKLNLLFNDLRYSVPGKKGKVKEVLHGANGEILCGRLTAIWGPSGAGKSSLLNVLAGFKTKKVTGSILINGVERHPILFRTQACYIPQNSALMGQLTTWETLRVAARLKLTASNRHQCEVVSDVMDLVGLTNSKDTAVSNLSGGEQKRLSIGVELITDPPIMLFDEPTSGLDSVSSAQIIGHLHSLASSGRAVACVIHQPSSQLCELFDDVIVVTAGRVLYCGPIKDMVPIFEKEGFHCPQYHNRADFALEVACGERGRDISGLLKRAEVRHEATKNSAAHKPKLQPNTQHRISLLNKIEMKKLYPIGQCSQFWILFRRCMLCTYRNLHVTHIRIICHILVAILLGVIYYKIGDEANKINSNIACIFFIELFLFYMNGLPVILSYPVETAVVLREHLNNWYSLSSYFFASCISFVPLQLICPTVFIVIAYYMTGQPFDTMRVLRVLLIVILLAVLGQGVGVASGALVDPQMALVVVPVLTIPMMLFSGFFLRIPDIPSYLRWVAQVSFFRHAFEGITTSVYGYDRPNLSCSESEMYCHFLIPAKFLEHLELYEDAYWINVGALSTWIVVLYLTLFLSLKWKVYKSK